MDKNFRLFADCVQSLRAAEREWESNPTPFNNRIVRDLQGKVDAWLRWVSEQKSISPSDLPPFIRARKGEKKVGTVSNDVLQQLYENHSAEEVEEFMKTYH